MNYTVELFIPRILPNVYKNDIIDEFHLQNIGKIVNIQSIRKTNEKNNKYWFAFLEVELYYSPESFRFLKNLQSKHSPTHVYYTGKIDTSSFKPRQNIDLYWEVKIRVEPEKYKQTNIHSFPVCSKPKVMVSECTTTTAHLEEGEILEKTSSWICQNSLFGKSELAEIYLDFLDLEREIYEQNHLQV